ncbi:MAG: cytochrome P450 [Verrucomicrobiales bacterium]|nr:cytochrome P450 [Verrucomicrobiales bacterium]
MHYDIHDPTFAQNPYPAYAELRTKCPVMRSLLYGKFWLLSRYEDVKAAALDWKTYTSSVAGVTAIPIITPRTEPMLPIEVDPPLHSRYRALMAPTFAPARIEQMRPRLTALAVTLIEKILACPRGEIVDLVSAYAVPLSIGTLAAFTGLPSRDADQWSGWINRMFDLRDRESGQQAAAEFGAYIDELIARRRGAPTDDFVSKLIASEVEGHRLTDREIHSFLTVTFGAGFETTQDAMSATLHHLAEHPADRQRMRTEPALIPFAVEEFLRYITPIQIFGRNTTRDTTLHGVTIPQGDIVALGFGSANHDPEHFPDPGQVILDRTPNRHLAFGAGPHTCLGAPVARLEMEVMLTEFLQRVPGWRVAPGDTVQWKPRGDRRGLARLPVVIADNLQP